MGMVGVERPGGTWGILPPLQTGKGTSTLHLPSSSACPLLPKVKRSGCKAGKKVTPSRTAPIFPAKPFSEISGLGLTCCCRSAAERPRRCATLHPAMRRGAGRKPQAANRLRTGGGERARAHLGSAPRAPAPPLPATASRETPAPPLVPLVLNSREGKPVQPRTLLELSKVLSSGPGPFRWPAAL